MAAKGHYNHSSPQIKNQWLKGKLIGSGSFGSVHLAIDNATGALFVAKSARSDSRISSLKSEADILENLDSPHIIKCIGKDTNGSTGYSLFFEYMAGGSLSDVVQNFGGRLDEELIRLYTRGILQGLEYVHQNGIMHCDVKCQNVLVGSSGAVKLADFGCAQRLTSNRTSSKPRNRTGGTPMWMAPEVLRNEQLDFSADIWSLGCTVIEMATGRSPWGGDEANPMATMLKIAKGNAVPEFPQDLSPMGLDFLSRCLERNPQRRWTAQKLLSHPFVTRKTRYAAAAISPISVLNGSVYESDDDYDDEDDEFVSRTEALRGEGCLLNVKGLANSVRTAKNGFEESEEGWVTVRNSISHAAPAQ